MNETNWWKTDHTADQCQFEPCDFCGCCAHGKQDAKGCKTSTAPAGMSCPNGDCGCTGGVL